MKIVCLGDSLTYGYCAPREKIWTKLAAEQTGWQIVNAGVPGDTTGGMLARFSIDVVPEKPDAVFIMGGGNDHVAGCPAHVMQANVMAMAQQALYSGSRAVIGVPTPVVKELLPPAWAPLWSHAAEDREYRRYLDWLRVFANGYPFGIIDFETPFLPEARAASRETYIDGVHLTPAGHEKMAALFVSGMKGMLEQEKEV